MNAEYNQIVMNVEVTKDTIQQVGGEEEEKSYGGCWDKLQQHEGENNYECNYNGTLRCRSVPH